MNVWGSYKPPPYRQLGDFVEDSINDNEENLVRSLEKRATESDSTEDVNKALPSFFADIDTLEGRHLVEDSGRNGGLEVAKATFLNDSSGGGGLAAWATAPLVLIAVLITSLIGLLIFRRNFTRRRKVSKVGKSNIVCGSDNTDNTTTVNFDGIRRALQEMR